MFKINLFSSIKKKIPKIKDQPKRPKIKDQPKRPKIKDQPTKKSV